MTHKFDAFVRLLMESSFADLPDTNPYGFWVSRGGDFFIVPFQGHCRIASQIVRNNPALFAEYEKMNKEDRLFPDSFLSKKKGWMRVVCAPPRLWYNFEFGHGITVKQQQVIDDLSTFYDLEPKDTSY